MTIPAGHVRRTEPAQALVFDDDILEDFVESSADVDIAVCERRAVVQNELGRACAAGLDFLVKASPMPTFQALRLAGRQVGFHGEAGPRQV
jgi:hypothetical protein